MCAEKKGCIWQSAMAFDGLSGFGTATLVMAVAAVIVLCTVYIVYRVRKSDLQSYNVTTRPIRLSELAEAVEIKRETIPPTVRGTDFSYSFWLYVARFDSQDAPPNDKARAVFFRGDKDGVHPSSTPFSPLVVLDNEANRLKVLLKTSASRTDLDVEQIIADPRGAGWVVATVEYMPLQRWVSIVIVIKGPKLTIYLDGDMYTMENASSLNRTPAASRAGVNSQMGVLPSETNGPIFVGKMPFNTKSIDGTLAKLQFFNYALERSDARTLYLEGPQQRTFMATIGLPSYAIQAPIYKM